MASKYRKSNLFAGTGTDSNKIFTKSKRNSYLLFILFFPYYAEKIFSDAISAMLLKITSEYDSICNEPIIIMHLQFFKQSITWQETHPFPLLFFQRQYFYRIYDHKSLSLLKSICNMTRWISLSGPRDIAWVVLYSRFVAPATQCVKICWDSITHPCIILGRCYQNVCHCY